MPIHRYQAPRGRLDAFEIDSPALAGNLVGDPARRRVTLYLPPGYDEGADDYPLLVALAGFTGSGLKLLSWQAFGENLPQRVDRLVEEGRMGPVVVALPDCFTALGGNQYVNSAALGRWENFLLDEMLPAIEARYRLRPGAAHRAVFGKSSGGYGALVQALRHGDRWAAVASHSADVDFNLTYLRDMPRALDALAAHGGDVSSFVEALRAAPKIRGDEMYALMLLAMSASYDPDPAAPYGVRLPVDRRTCALDPRRWEAWLAHDPLTLVERDECQRRLRGLRTLFIDCGSRDQYALHYGNRRLAARLASLGIEHRYEEFDDTHSGVDYRLDVSLPLLYAAISASPPAG